MSGRELRLLSKPLLAPGAGGVPGNSSSGNSAGAGVPGVGDHKDPFTSLGTNSSAALPAVSSPVHLTISDGGGSAASSFTVTFGVGVGGGGGGGGSGRNSPVQSSRSVSGSGARGSGGGAGSAGRKGRRQQSARRVDKEVMIMRRKSHYSHELSHDEYVKMGENESLDYHIAHNELLREEQWATTRADYRADDLSRYVVCVLIGAMVGFAAFVIRFAVETLLDQKFTLLQSYLSAGREGVCLVLYIAVNLAMVLASAVLVAFYIPQAAGAGIAEVKGYLNGNRIPKAINVKTFIGKFFGTIMNVAASLPAGPEGPMIHIGAMIGGGVSQPRSKTLNCDLPEFTGKFQTDKDRRDFISVGSACGFAAAFSAPVGGILFSLEEASSFWSPTLTVRTFLASMTATVVSNFLLSAPSGSVGSFDVSRVVVFNQGTSAGTLYHWWEFFFFVALGCLGGVAGAAFVALNVRIVKWRRSSVNPKPWRRVAEICVLSVAISIIAFVLPFAVGCSAVPPPPAGGSDGSDYSALQTMQFNCPSGSFNPLASLIFTGLSQALKNLFSHSGPTDVFSLGTLALFGVVYFLLTGIVAGSVAPAGALIPAFIIGATLGRFCGILLHWVSADIAPGTYAVIGAAAFLSGTSRITISLSVIMVEITNDLSFLPPIMLAVMCAKWVGDLFTHPLYDQMLETKFIPFLEADPPHELDKMTAGDLMSHDIKYLPADVEVGHALRVMLSCTHQGFPVVYSNPSGSGHGSGHGVGAARKLRGLILRKQLLVLFAAKVWESSRRFSPAEFRAAMAGSVPTASALDREFQAAERSARVNLVPYMNRSPFSVHTDFHAPYVFRLFRAMGLRHLPVVNDDNEVMGMITRKDLIAPMIHARFEVMMMDPHNAARAGAQPGVASPFVASPHGPGGSPGAGGGGSSSVHSGVHVSSDAGNGSPLMSPRGLYS